MKKSTAMELLLCLKSVIVEPVLFLYMFSTFMQYVACLDLIYFKVCASQWKSAVCEDLYNPDNKQILETVLSESSVWILKSTVALALPSMVSAHFLGSWGDTYGRKYPLLVPSIGSAVSCLVYIWMSLTNGPVWPILIASTLSGIFGGFVSCIMAVMSYVSNISSTPTRTVRVSLLEAMTFVGGTAGPFAGSALKLFFGREVVFGSIALCNLIIIVYVIWRVPEIPGPGSSDTAFKSGDMSHFKISMETCFKERPGRGRAAILCFLVCSLVIMTTTAGELDVSYLYAKDTPLQWDHTTYSHYFGIKYAVGSLAVLIGTPLLAHYKVSDHIVCTIGIISKITGFILLSFSNTTTFMFLVPLASMLSFFCIPSLRSLLSKQVEAAELGRMFAFLAVIENISLLLGSAVFNSLYPVTKTIHRGFIFQLEAVLQVIPLIILGVTGSWKKSSSSTYAALEAPS